VLEFYARQPKNLLMMNSEQNAQDSSVSQHSSNEMLAAALSPEQFWKIREMWLSENEEDKNIAYEWLCNAIGKYDADANFFVLTFYKHTEDDDTECFLSDYAFWKMNFKTYPIYFGKDYRYTVEMIANFHGKEIVNTFNDYSRYNVGNCEPKWDLCQMICDKLRKYEHKFYNGLFAKGSS